jgi:hypothetical protein
MCQLPQNAPKYPEGVLRVCGCQIDASQQQAKVMAVGRLHDARRVARSRHGLLNDLSQPIERARCSIQVSAGILELL